VSLSLRFFRSGLDFEIGGERVLDGAREVAGLEFNGFLRTGFIVFLVFGLGDELDESLDLKVSLIVACIRTLNATRRNLMSRVN
jgi:hypothetical protein